MKLLFVGIIVYNHNDIIANNVLSPFYVPGTLLVLLYISFLIFTTTCSVDFILILYLRKLGLIETDLCKATQVVRGKREREPDTRR